MRTYLVLFSGGKDSFLSACRILNSGNKVVLLSFNGGAEVGEEYFTHGANRLIRRYGKNNVQYAGVYPTVGTIKRLNETWLYSTQKELGEKYPNITNCQFQCLHCQTAMWVAAIAYCIAKNIQYISCGYKKTDVFCTGIEEYFELIKDIALRYNITVENTLWDLGSDLERDEEMMGNCFEPQVLEPACMLGRPVINGFPESEQEDMIKFFKLELYNRIPDLIDHLVPIFKVIRLSNKAFNTFEYKEDTSNNGIY